MPQREPRLGDILDDYCPRERRITNHAVVAMINQDVKQTRCTTCDAEHEYKKAKVPTQRKKKTGTSALFEEVLTGMPRKPQPVAAPPGETDLPTPGTGPAPPSALETPLVADGAPPSDEVEGPANRQLIRATLPRPEGLPMERPIPEFTARTATMARPGRFRPHGGGGQGQGPGQGQGRRGGQALGADGHQGAGFRFGGRRGQGGVAAAGPSGGHGNRARPAQGGQGQGQGQHRRGSNKKRSK